MSASSVTRRIYLDYSQHAATHPGTILELTGTRTSIKIDEHASWNTERACELPYRSARNEYPRNA
ncbi:MAG: hypothetical protein AAGA50_29970 [Pseudomonadota bacterium]